MSDDDDILIGRLWSRREMLVAFGATAVVIACDAGRVTSTLGATATGASPTATGAATATAGATVGASATAVATDPPAGTTTASATAGTSGPTLACVVTPALTEGPFFLDEMLERPDITTDAAGGAPRAGLPLTIAMTVAQVSGSTCNALAGAVVDLWHCDAAGDYSGVSGVSGTWLRGWQRTDANGLATFQTIYPGWYQGRAVHIHLKVRTDPDAESGLEFTSQLFFDDAVSQAVFEGEAYAAKGPQDQANTEDSIYRETDGLTLLKLDGSATTGFTGAIGIGVQTQ